VIALPPRGLMGPCWSVIKKMQDAVIVVLDDTPENILERITFYDTDSRKIEKVLTEDERRRYLREIEGDVTYFKRSWRKAHLIVNISGCAAEGAALRPDRSLGARWTDDPRRLQRLCRDPVGAHPR
jgi:shikimate kinase